MPALRLRFVEIVCIAAMALAAIATSVAPSPVGASDRVAVCCLPVLA